jgi:hypothetical protein
MTRVVCPGVIHGDAEKRWKEAFDKATQYFKESGVTFDKVKV